MTQLPPGDIFTRRVCLQLDGMDAITVRPDVAYGRRRVVFAWTSTTRPTNRTIVAGAR
jgi:hypothetical protein